MDGIGLAPVLKDAITGPVSVDFKLGGLPPGQSFEMDLLLGRENDNLPSGTLVQALGPDDAVIDSANFYYTVAEKPASLRDVSLVAQTNSDGELKIRVSPYRPVSGLDSLRFAITAMQVRPAGTDSAPQWIQVLSSANLNENPISRNASPPNPVLGLQSRAGGEGGEVSSIPAEPWLDDGGVAFSAPDG